MEVVGGLLAETPELLDQFNAFLPEGYAVVTLPPYLAPYAKCYTDTPPSDAEAEHLASSFLRRISERFADAPDKLEALHAILASCPAELPSNRTPWKCATAHHPLLSVYGQLRSLLDGEDDLASELHQYVPAWCYTKGHIHVAVPPP